MTILIANIGTSDIAVKLNKDFLKPYIQEQNIPSELAEQLDRYYLPIGFDRNEPNQDKAIAELDADQKKIWEQRQNLISTLCDELQVKCNRNRFSFRDLTSHLWQEYQKEDQKDSKKWHSRLSPGRIWGVMNAAIEQAKVTTIYMFVTDQPEFEGEPQKRNPGYDTDCIHLFHILKLWFSHEFGNNVQVKPVILPKAVSAIDLDGLLAEYYRFFNQFDKSEKILISVKGGTPQMQTALRVQAISSDIDNQIYLEPELSLKNLLAGEPSNCRKISYWQYQRTQKYQTVKQLLNKRWDFDGARVILKQWQEILENLEKEEIENNKDIQKSQNRIDSVIKALNIAVGYLNLDATHAESQAISSPVRLADWTTSYNHLLNLYTQCCLFWELDRIADFLTRMGSFYEETLHELIRALGGEQYFDRNNYPDDWYLNINEILNKNNALAQEFYQAECTLKKSSLVSSLNKQKKPKCIQNGIWINPLKKNLFKFPGRLTKRNFVQSLTNTQKVDKTDSQDMIAAMKALDYWMAKRNQLIHGAKGVSKLRMKEAFKNDKALVKAGQMNNKDIYDTVSLACDADQILVQMSIIVQRTLKLMKISPPPLIMNPNQEYLNPDTDFYYLYSDIRDWVINQLNQDV
ncbi:MAG: hypothetical protein AB4426_05530 [Xenococcaceae cyanobacterium]